MQYLKEIGAEPILSRQEELALAKEVAAGNTDARERMIRANLRLVVYIAKSMKSSAMVPLEDRICEGNIGLIRAVEGFNPDLGVKFSTYAAYWIKQSIIRSAINTGRLVRVPSHCVDLVSRAKKGLDVRPRYDTVGGEPSRKTTKQLEATIAQGRAALGAMSCVHSFDDMEVEGPEWDRPGPVQCAQDAEQLATLEVAMAALSARERHVMRARNGIGYERPMTLVEIGEDLGYTRERIRQIEMKATRTLTRAMVMRD